ncbi:uncharacterized protein TrAtP1_006023 [Trichoderma atroviride]|uniref:Uncharacterized protein n=1 Tax=Hypocrea atroviridis (strain ATCC 20476 / IMI 206040) TaxID=452589 RepID=G9PAG1_HYPAI|nr:uncharacterized protein TRIATDRAFT_322484 [Trichoderma atroviride IMI 206040]EHK39996.1 hypothetical protein TRIATDRAFT_322484 [Trichoderma atroviride IMI 206040]UKZ64813.1 hypothetical protein TrAtP1_006023 [Trichoderma atroviride]
MPACAIESRIAPPNLTIADITVPKNEFTFGSFGPNSSSYQDALACLRMYRKQVTQLNYSQRREIIDIITKGHFFRTKTAMKSPFGHKFYRYARQSDFAAERLSWPEYIIMRALYKDDLPPLYISHVKQTFGTAAIEDFSYQFFEYFPQMNDNTAKAIIPTPKVSIRSGRILISSRKASAEDNLWPAPKRKKPRSIHKNPDTPTTVQTTLKAHTVGRAANDAGNEALISAKEATKQPKSTSAVPNASALEVTPAIDLDARDILDRLPSKTFEGSKGSIRLPGTVCTLEESHRGLETKLGAMTTAFDTMNTTIETIVTEARADREGYNHVLSSIKDVMMGMADSIKDIKEQL